MRDSFEIRVYAHVGNRPELLKEKKAQGFTAFKTGIKNSTQSGTISSARFIDEAVEAFDGKSVSL